MAKINPSSLPSTDSNKLLRAQMITRQARMIFSAYRRDDFADPDGFVLQVGMVLERYSDAVINQVTSPLTGIQRRHKGRPPDIASIVEACDDEQESIEVFAWRSVDEVQRWIRFIKAATHGSRPEQRTEPAADDAFG